MKAKKTVLLSILVIATIFSGSQILGTGSFVCDGMIKRNTGASPIHLESQVSNKTRQKVNVAALEERLSALYPR